MKIMISDVIEGSEYQDFIYDYYLATRLDSIGKTIEILATTYCNPLQLYKNDTIECLVNIVTAKTMRIDEITKESHQGCTRLFGRINTKKELPDGFSEILYKNDKMPFIALETKDGTFISYSSELAKYRDGDDVFVDVPLFTLVAWKPIEHGTTASHFRVQMYETWKVIAETMKGDNKDLMMSANVFLFDLFLQMLDPMKDHLAIPNISKALDNSLDIFRNFISQINSLKQSNEKNLKQP